MKKQWIGTEMVIQVRPRTIDERGLRYWGVYKINAPLDAEKNFWHTLIKDSYDTEAGAVKAIRNWIKTVGKRCKMEFREENIDEVIL